MTYDDNGCLKSVTSTGLGVDVDTYSGARLIVNKATAGYGTYYYTYADSQNHYRVSSITNNLITENYSFDTYGNQLSTTVTGSGSKKIITSNTYSSDGNQLISATDSSGSTVTYGYGNTISKRLGLPTSITAPNGTVTTNTYDTYNRVTKTSIANTATLTYNYVKGCLNTIVRKDNADNSQTYTLSNNAFGNTTSIKVGSRTLASYTYKNGYGNLLTQTDGNGKTITYTYDNLDRVKTATYSDGPVLTYTYTGEGNLYSVTATENGTTTKYIYGYDSLGRLVSSERKDGGTSVIQTRQGYDNVNRLINQAWQLGSTTYTESFTYNSSQDGTLNKHTTATGQTLTMGYDGLRRLSTVTGGIYGKTYTYRDINSTRTTNQVASITYDLPTDRTFSYTYDNMGNIATYTDANGNVTYTYDAQGQLTKAAGSTTYNYTYDKVGNLLTGNGHTYTYSNSDWKDLLTKVDGQTITYDTIGNPLSYYNGTSWTFTWKQGRRLATASDGTNSISYTYDADGVRTSKTVNGTKHTYYYAGGKLLRETYGSNTLDFFYDANGYPYALKYNNTKYYYITNLQGDVMYIVNGSGTVVATYSYDPYGNVLTATGSMAEVNPLRYRGYYYDTESKLYYLQSRYYDPEIGRFLNADAFASTGQGILGNNMFVYCNNSPILYVDDMGTMPRPSMIKMDETEYYPLKSCIADTPEEQVSGTINGQGILPYHDHQIGLGSYSQSGCAYIAMYNAMQLIGRPQALDTVTFEMFWYGAVAFGAGGVGPWAASSYLDAHGIDHIGSFSTRNLVDDISEGSVIVFTIMNNKNSLFDGWHAMTALYTNGKYLVFNRYNNSTTYETYSTLSEAFSGGKLIHGIRIN